MDILFLTQDTGKILGPIAKYVLGPILNYIFVFLNWIRIPNVGLAIILFTIVIYLLLMPLTIKQQKFSKLQQKMQPELQAIQKKYKDKKDQASQMAMNQETQEVYAKYGVSPTGSCVQLLIQMPILFALYRVIYAIPAYVTQIGDTFRVLADKIISTDNGQFIINAGDDMKSVATAVRQFQGRIDSNLSNGIVDVLNKTSSTDMIRLSEHYDLSALTYNGKQILSTYNASGNVTTRGLLDTYNNFLGINIGNTPLDTIKTAWSAAHYLIVFGAILVPVLAAVTQWLNVKLAPQAANNNSNANDQAAQMQSSMKAMNTFMPLFSAFICFSLPMGLGIYWIAGAVVRCIQQVLINKHIDKLDIDEEIKKNVEKRNKRLQKAGIDPSTITANANRQTRTVERLTKMKEENEAKVREATDSYSKKSSGGSIAAKANLVKEYNERNNK